MNQKSIDGFHEALIANYRELIHEAIMESEINFRSCLDTIVLSAKLKEVVAYAELEGLSYREIQELIQEGLERMPHLENVV